MHHDEIRVYWQKCMKQIIQTLFLYGVVSDVPTSTIGVSFQDIIGIEEHTIWVCLPKDSVVIV